MTADPKTKITKKGDMYWFLPEKMLPCISAIPGDVKEFGLSCVMDALALWVTNKN